MALPGFEVGSRPALRRVWLAFFSLVLLIVGGVVITGGAVVAGPAPVGVGGQSGCEWTQITTVNPEVYNTFHGVAHVSENDIWSVGSKGPGNFGQQTLIEHWDGSAWSVVDSPNPSNDENELEDVVALAANDVWAAGYIDTFSGGAQTLILHWDGASWSRVASPNPGTFRNSVYSLAAVAPNDIWAVGYYWLSGQRHTTMILHWDGSAWSVVPSPNASSFDNHLFAVDALAANDIWAVGRYMEISGRWLTLTLHWEGSAWSIVPSPNVSSINNHLLSVSMLSSSDGWAAGFLCPHGNCFEGHFSSQTEELFILHWDGSAWSIMESPKLDADFAFFKDVLAASPGNVWAVGGYGSNDDPKSLVMRWDGSAWELYTAPSPSESCCPLLDSVTALPNGDMWAVGDYHFPAHIVFRTLAAYYPASCGVTVTPTPLSSTATATRTPIPPTLTATSPPAATSTPTSIPATGTPLAATATSTATNTATNTGVPTSTSTDTPTPPVPTQTPTSCSIIFSDVPEGSTFHTPVRCLACRGILGGYSDGTFRPGDPVTRGQIAKIVSNAAGWSDVPAGQSFEDAQPEHTFYLWIERMFSRGIINGYPCGGPGEPCNPPGMRPYFRPAGNATRGQIAKIVSDAAGFIGAPVDQSFEDVSPTHTFYLWIERLADRAIMSGYICGGPGEPCNPPGGRPYFRPAAATTRGQTAKIVSNAFFPECASAQR